MKSYFSRTDLADVFLGVTVHRLVANPPNDLYTVTQEVASGKTRRSGPRCVAWCSSSVATSVVLYRHNQVVAWNGCNTAHIFAF